MRKKLWKSIVSLLLIVTMVIPSPSLMALAAETGVVEETKTIPHTKTTGTTDYFTFSQTGWSAMGQSSEHVWSDQPGADPSAIWYEVKFTGHKIDVYSGKNHPMGMVEYFIDGVSKGEYSLHNSSNINSTLITTFADLEEGEHTFKAVATGKREEGTGTGNSLIDCAQVVVYYNRAPKEQKLHGVIVDSNLQYTQDKFEEVETTEKTAEAFDAWKNDKVLSEISLVSVDSSYTEVKAEASDLTGDAGTIAKENVDLKFIKSADAYTGMPGYGNPTRPVPEGGRAEANEIIYEDASVPVSIGTNKVKNIWVAINVPADTEAGTYTGTVKVSAKELAEPLSFTYTVNVADAVLPNATDFKDGFDMELWQNPYRVAEYYDVEPFSDEHFEILESLMGTYKKAGGHAITTTIVEEAWAGQTYGETDVKYPSMVQWTKKADGTWKFDYTDFDAWVRFNKKMGIGDKIICYSIAPWTNAVVYYDEATKTTIKKGLTAGAADWREIWTAFLNDLADHLKENGWFEQAYIGIDERGFSQAGFDLIHSIERGEPSPTRLKIAGAMDGFVDKKSLALQADVLSVGSIAVKKHPTEFEEIRKQREESGFVTTMYTCTGHIPGSFSLSAPGESYWTMMYANSIGTEGYLRWSYDSWTADPLNDTTHNAFEAGDCFLVFPDDKLEDGVQIKESTRFAKLAEGVRDVNKLWIMKSEIPSMASDIDTLMSTVKAKYDAGSLYLTDVGKTTLTADMKTMKSEIARLTEKYVELKANGVTDVTSVTINGDAEIRLQLGKTAQLEVTVLPENVLNNTVTWTTSNPTVATVKDGVVTGLATGRAVITATSNQNKAMKASVTVNVTEVGIEEEAQVSYYSFDNVEGTTLTDEWGNRNGTLAASCRTADGKSGKALNVTEAGAGATIEGTSALNENWSVAYWVKTTSTLDKEVTALEDAAKKYSFSLKMAADRGAGFRVGDNGGDVLTYGVTFEKDQWYHLTWVQDKASGLSLYVNGKFVQSNAWTKGKAINAPVDVIGGTGFTGLIDEVKVYNRVLDAGEVLTTMKLKGLNILEANPTVSIGETYQITTNLVTDSADKTITYVSENPEIASVDANGVVTAHKKGTAVITVTGGGFTEKVTVTVKVKLYSNSRIPQYELDDKYLKDIEKKPGTNRQYLGQPDMVRTKSGRLITAYPVGHGHGPLVMQISDDEGETWTEKTNLPASFATCQETPTLYVLNLADGTERIMLISACPTWDLNRGGWDTAYSDNNGETWTEYKHFWSDVDGKHFPTIVAMASLIQLKDENGNDIQKWMGVFHDYGYVNYKTYLTFDENGNEQWSKPEAFLADYRAIESSHQMCEIGLFRSPDGERIVGLARSQTHAHLSTMFWSDDEGKTWSEPIEIQGSLAGERHKAVYDPISGRLVITFREIVYGEKIDNSWMAGDWVAWVGTYEDLMDQGEGEYRILLEQDWSMNAKSGDTGYAGVVVLEDGTFIMDSYGHFDEAFSKANAADGSYDVRTDLCYIKQAKFKLSDIENPKEPEEPENIALGKAVVSNGCEIAGADNEGNVNDGDIATRWDGVHLKDSDIHENSWIYIDLGKRYDINKVVAKYYNKVYATDYDLQVSDDAEKWTTIATVTKADGGPTHPTDTFDLEKPVTARYVKLFFRSVNKAAGGSGVAVTEFEIYGTEAKAPAPNTYRVTIVNGTMQDGTAQGDYAYNTKLTVKANAPEKGKEFAGWEVNGVLVSTKNEYEFFVGTDLIVAAQYKNTAAEKPQIEPKAELQSVTVTKRADGRYDIRYLTQLVVPEDYTIEQAGLVWRTKNNTEDLVVGGTNVKVTNISKISNTYQYSVTIKGVPAGNTVPGAAFAKFVDADGNETEYYYSVPKLGVTK